jgi:DNA-binding NtrC family response regulator
MITFLNKSEQDVPESVHLELRFGNSISFSDTLRGDEKVVIISDLRDAAFVRQQQPLAHILLSIDSQWSITPRESFKMQAAGVTDLYTQDNLEAAMDAIAHGLANPISYNPIVKQEQVLSTVNDLGYLQVGGFKNESIIGQSVAMQEILQQLSLLKDHNVDLLFLGEPGVGKTSILEAFTANTKQKSIRVNINEFSDELFISELSGYKKGAFTGALEDRKGILDEYSKGTVFFDEIGDLSKGNQTKLLSMLQERTYRAVGDNKNVKKFEGRFVFATNRDMEELVTKGDVRQDFLSRLRRFVVKIPALRDRREDIPLLIHHHLNKLNKTFGTSKEIALSAVDMMSQLHWRDNVRQLENLLAPMVVLEQSNTITPEVVIKFMNQIGDPNLVDSAKMLNVTVPVEIKIAQPEPIWEVLAYDRGDKEINFNGASKKVSENHEINFKSPHGVNIKLYEGDGYQPGATRIFNNVKTLEWYKPEVGEAFIAVTSDAHKKKGIIELGNVDGIKAATAEKVEKIFEVDLSVKESIELSKDKSQLIYTGAHGVTNYDTGKEAEIKFTSPNGISLEYLENINGKVRVLDNITELHWRYASPSPNIPPSVAFESNLHSNGMTCSIDWVDTLKGQTSTQLHEDMYRKPIAKAQEVTPYERAVMLGKATMEKDLQLKL